jgi:hypothetical protein
MPMSIAREIDGRDRRLYMVMPLYFLPLAGWFSVFGVSYAAMHLFAIAWGVIAGIAWYIIVKCLSKDRVVALLAATLNTLSYDYVNLMSARYDCMSAALVACVLAAYLVLRERNLSVAVLTSQIFATAALMTHPYSVLGVFGVIVFALVLDRRRLLWSHLGLAILPHLVAMTSWVTYIAQDPQLFRAQFVTNVARHARSDYRLLTALVDEIRERYVVGFAGWRPGVPIYMRVKLVLLLLNTFGMVGCLASRNLRAKLGCRALLFYTVGTFLFLAFVEGTKWYVYLIYILPLYAATLAFWCGELAARGRPHSAAVWTGVALVVLFTCSTVWYRARIDVFGRAYLPALQYLQANISRGSLVFADGSFGMGLGFEKHVSDDSRLGFYTHRQAEYIVISSYWERMLNSSTSVDPGFGLFVRRLLGGYDLVFRSEAGGKVYRIYRRHAVGLAASTP